MAQHVDLIISRLHTYINAQLNSLSQSNPLMAIAKPLITRAIDNNVYKVESVLKQIANKDGLLDIDNILSEMIESIINTQPFRIDAKFLGELEIGGGHIKMNLPFVNKAVVLNQQDLLSLRDMLVKQTVEN